MRLLPEFLQHSVWRDKDARHKMLAGAYFIVGLVLMTFGHDTAALICLVGFVHETGRMDVAALRREMQAKRPWDDGQ